MKILFVASRLPHDRSMGGHGVVYQRIRRLAEREHEIGLVTFASPEDEAHLARSQRWLREVIRVPRPAKPSVWRTIFSPVPAIFIRYRSRAMQEAIGQAVQRGNYEIVVAEFGVMGQHLHWNPYLPAVRTVISVHRCYSLAVRRAEELARDGESPFLERLQAGRIRAFERAVYRSADRLITLNEEVRREILSLDPYLHVTVVPTGVDTVYFRPGRPIPRENALVFTADFGDEANVDAARWFLRETWPLLKARYTDLVFYLVGPDVPPDLLAQGKEDPRLVFTGRLDDIRPILARAKVFVCPIRFGSGLRGRLLQAMAAGVPVVSTTFGAEGIPVEMGSTGFLADTPEIMAQFISLLLEDSYLWQNVAARARAMVSERFSWDRSTDELERVLRECVD